MYVEEKIKYAASSIVYKMSKTLFNVINEQLQLLSSILINNNQKVQCHPIFQEFCNN